MRIFTITVSYAPAALLARCLIQYQKTRAIKPYRHVVALGHYPINRLKNNNDTKLIVDCFDGIELWDPCENLGSAQTQNWILSRLDIKDGDYFINLDPDSHCPKPNWDHAMKTVLDNNENCALISCMAPMVERYLNGRTLVEMSREGNARFAVPQQPTPFNLSMWRYSFIKEIGGIPQMGLWWGETEAPFYSHCQRRGKYHAYLSDFLENEDGKFMQDKEQNEWKDLHMRNRSTPFHGNFEEFLRWKYPSLAEMNTCKDLSNHNHP